MINVDLNADLGEGLNIEKDIMPFLSSCSIACGGHSGNQASMTDVGITGGGKGNNMLYLSGVQTKKVLTNEIIDKVVFEVEKKASELEKK